MKTNTCPTCDGTGRDATHRWPDGTPAACEDCDGYGFRDAARRQTFDLIPGESYAVHPPAARRPGVVYLSGVCRLLSVSADGRARFRHANGESFTFPLADNRISRF